jgi:ABC-type nitrate/sulfonate/bicarbonate transport system permease component
LVRVPAALPAIFSGARIAIAVCVIGAVFGELVGSNAGLGYLMQRDSSQFLTARVFAAIFILALMGVGLFSLLSVLERLLLPWRRYTTDRPSA